MIISITYIFAIAAGLLTTCLLAGLSGVLIGRRALRRTRDLAAAVEIAGARVAELESALAATDGRLNELLAERERTAALPTRPSLREAVALSRHGASVEELVSTCRIGQSEARLIQMLYGTTRATQEAPAGAEIH
jgi:hypothetical protein